MAKKETLTVADVLDMQAAEDGAALGAVARLITKLCEDAMQGRMRDEFQHYDAIAKLYTAIK